MHEAPMVLLLLLHIERAKQSLDKPVLLGQVQRKDAALQRVCTEELVVLEDNDIVALGIVSMVQNVEDVDIDV